ncbi:protein of unknown function [Nitrospira japonica]|uniref:Uncharacterized protein n=1 Tax=Nitrospira japonica TaxID=1325564 RepID=A0A1W1IB26_9BACT|nr:protein of unknown function [Nitrospira japonica]
MVALSLDKHMVSAALQKKSQACTPSRAGRMDSRHVSGQWPAGLSVSRIQSGGMVSEERSPG